MNTIKISIIALVLLVSGLSSCKKDDNSNSSTTTSNIVQQGTWRVTLFNDNGTDETNHFTGYSFSFNSNGTIGAVKASSAINGLWSTGTDDSQAKLNLDFGVTVPFDDLNDDWHIIEQSSTKMRLEDVSGGGGGTDLLTFEKN